MSPETQPKQEQTPDELVESSKEILEVSIAAIFEKQATQNAGHASHLKNVEIEPFVESEQKFMKAVLDAYERWSQEPNPVVLWDVDDTLGKQVFEGKPEWYLRPSMAILIPYLSEHYPNVKNGIISNRTQEGALEGFEKYADLFDQFPFFTVEEIYSTKDVPYDYSVQQKFDSFIYEKYPTRGDPSFVMKYLIIDKLKTEHPETNYKVIDDNVIATEMGKDGVDVYGLEPPHL